MNIQTVRNYWKGKNVPQRWYSDRDALSLAWFNELRYYRYNLYYSYLKEDAEFEYHHKEKVLEIGCGIGTDMAEYALNGALVSGIDLGPDQIELTKLNFALRGLDYETLEEGNAEDLRFEDDSFDLVYCFGVIHHTVDPQQAINEIHRVLKKDGKAIIMLYARGWKHYIKRCLIHGILMGKWFKAGFNWKRVYSEVSEVHGNSPKTEVYTKRQVRKMFSAFPGVQIRKRRMGEFFDYPPYRTYLLPAFITNVIKLFNFEALFGENWVIKASKAIPPERTGIGEVLFKHY